MARGTLLIPVENQARELDPKLLLAAVAAGRGYDCIVGERGRLDFRLARFPRGIYLAKSMTARSRKVFSILRQLGHEIAVWDEEVLVRYRFPEIYYGRRLAPETLALVSHLFAWGEDNAEVLRKYPHYAGTPISVTGNPRGDLLRPELRGRFAAEAEAIRREQGDFLLVNTNFGHVNAYHPSLNLLLAPDADGRRAMGRGSVGMTRAYAEGRAAHKQAVFESFFEMVPFLHDAFPEIDVVIRPHPVEEMRPWHALAEKLPRARIVPAAGSPIPWLMATHALVHNCCTTGIEAWLLGTPSVTFRPVQSDLYEEVLPNAVSHDARDLETLRSLVARILAGELGRLESEVARRVVEHHIAALDGPLACERIVDVLDEIEEARRAARPPGPGARLAARWRGLRRRIKKERTSRRAGAKNSPEIRRQRYPGIELAEVRERLDRFRELLGATAPLSVTRVAEEIYRVAPAGGAR